MIREKRRKKALIKRIVLIVLSIWLLLIVAGIVVVNVFVVEQVEIEGNELYDHTLIEQTVLNDEYSWNSLYVLLKYTFVDTEKLPFIDTMEISLKNPKTLKIKLYEKGMMGYLYIPSIGENAYFDKDGFVVETSMRIIEGVPLIEGLSCNEVVLYEKLPIEDTFLKKILMLTQNLKRDDLIPENVEWEKENLIPDKITYDENQTAILTYQGIDVELGSINYLTEKIKRIGAILPTLDGRNGTLHLERWSQENQQILFEEEILEEESPETDTENSSETESEE